MSVKSSTGTVVRSALPPKQSPGDLVKVSEQLVALADRIEALREVYDGRLGFELEFSTIDPRGEGRAATPHTSARFEKNRYLDIVPVEDTRIILSSIEGEADSDYINANKIQGMVRPTFQETYIASQGPLPTTVHDFWRMIWEHDVQLVVMLANIVEMGMPKCYKYWVDTDEEAVLGDFKLEKREVISFGDFERRDFELTHAVSGDSRVVSQIHYSEWPDQGTPSESFTQLIQVVNNLRDQRSREAPMVVHCSAGIGRTGVFCVVDHVLARLAQQLETEGDVPAPPLFDVGLAVHELRTQRHGMVQTVEQYAFCHHSIYAGARALLAKNANN